MHRGARTVPLRCLGGPPPSPPHPGLGYEVLESDYKNEDGSKVASCRPRTPPRRHYCEELDLYRQMMRLKQMYNHCAAHETNRISVTEARQFLIEVPSCGSPVMPTTPLSAAHSTPLAVWTQGAR